MRIKPIAAMCWLLLILVACGTDGGDQTATPPTASNEETTTGGQAAGEAKACREDPSGYDAPKGMEAPPPVTIHYGEECAELRAWTFCYATGCADGAPPEDLVHVGSVDEVFVEFPLDWTFSATFAEAGSKCPRSQTVDLEEAADGRWRVTPAGYAGDYEVTLNGRGDGDLFTTFRWETPEDGPLPKPTARIAVLADHDGRVDSYGVELEVQHLAETPKDATATVTVEAADGEAITFEATPSKMGCFPEGTLYWDGPDDKGLEAAQLGEGPFTYDVKLQLDGETYRATATWPDEEIRNFAPSVRLHFEPELPGLS